MRFHNGGTGMGTGGWILMTVSMVVFWTVVVLLVFALIRYLDRAPHRHPGPSAHIPVDIPSPEQILAARYARGDIDGDEYQRRSRTLRETGARP
jgi:putative membrane protein